MAMTLTVGDEAPNFDLSSTEDVVLMLRDEVPRNFVILYFFGETSDQASTDLGALAAAREELAKRRINVLGVAPLKMPDLKTLQADLGLPFPLCRDDRNFSAAYGVGPAEEDQIPAPALVLVGRDQTVSWLANPAGDVSAAVAEICKLVDGAASTTENYPKKVVNRLVDRWVN